MRRFLYAAGAMIAALLAAKLGNAGHMAIGLVCAGVSFFLLGMAMYRPQQ